MNDNYSYHFGKTVYDLSSRTFIMGVLNVTPDSFSDGGKFLNPDDAIAHAKQMEQDGADFIDVGGMSTRPGADEVSQEEEMKRVIPVIKALKNEIKIPISIDTYRSGVADEALANGALIVNDISGFNFDADMPKIIAKYKASAIVMHMKGTPKDMQKDPQYDDIIAEVMKYFEDAVWKANVEAIDQLIIDPGIGFGKTLEHNLKLIKNINEFKRLDCPVMVGVSRKSMIGKLNGDDSASRIEGTIALNTIAALNGANIVRVHDVKACKRASSIVDSYQKIE